jgi:hypothetical protein
MRTPPRESGRLFEVFIPFPNFKTKVAPLIMTPENRLTTNNITNVLPKAYLHVAGPGAGLVEGLAAPVSAQRH